MLIRLLCWLFPYKELGWTEIGEVFYRWTLIKTRWFSIYLHRLDCQRYEPITCHDHPWNFLTIILSGGYWEYHDGRKVWRPPGNILYRRASWHHVVQTKGVNWSLVICGRKHRDWGFKDSCDHK